MKKTMLLCLYILINVSCKKESNIIRNEATAIIEDKNFLITENIKTEVLEDISDSTLLPINSFILKDYLIIDENKTDHLLHVIKIPEDKYLSKFIDRGAGPGEGLTIGTFYSNEEDVLGIYDNLTKKIFEVEIDTLFSKKKVKNEYHLTSLIGAKGAMRFNNQIYFMSRNNNERYALLSTDLNGKNLKGYGKLPEIDKKVFDLKRNINFDNVYTAKWDRNKEIFAISYVCIPLLKIFNAKNNKWITIAGPDDITPSLETLKSMFFYMDVKITDKYIYALYHGRKYDLSLKGPQEYNTNIIYVFDHQGNPKKKIMLDKGLFNFSIYKDAYLYGIGIGTDGASKLIKAKL
jgi:hypothetical protein